MTVFGPLITGDMVEQGVIDALQFWLPTYLAEVERVTGREPGSLQAPRSYLISDTYERRPQDQIPACLVISPGLAEAPTRTANGDMNGVFRIEAVIFVAANTRENVNRLAKAYGAAARKLLLQKRTTAATGLATLVGEKYDSVPQNLLDIGSFAAIVVDIPVAGFDNADGGPLVPVVPPAVPGDWPLVETTHIDIEREEIPV